ncbi:hypothetical protein KSS87_021658 [Heliosperma pusillum]|nr:hypothetical protein KSS87_021658 [Heliosperma pusillum]
MVHFRQREWMLSGEKQLEFVGSFGCYCPYFLFYSQRGCTDKRHQEEGGREIPIMNIVRLGKVGDLGKGIANQWIGKERKGFEAYVGLLLLRTAFVGVVSEWQVVFCGVLLLLMAVGNFANTVQTMVVKSRFKAKMKKSKSKQQLD